MTSRGGPRGARRGKRDFQKENVMMLKEKQRLNRLAKEREAAAAAERRAFKMKKFERVESKVKAMATRGPEEVARAREAKFLRAGEANKRAAARAAHAASVREAVDEETAEEMAAAEAARARRRGSSARAKVRAKRKAPVPRERGKLAPREKKNYLASNARATIRGPGRTNGRTQGRQRGGGENPTARADFGKIPEYLIKRKIEAAKKELEEAANAPDPDCPPGMVRMPEEERLETLAILEENRSDVIQQLNTMPLRCDTFGLRRKKHALEAKLEETEEAIKVFSRDKVFVRPDDL